jgi:AcrR family transcriptional regulator
MMLPARAGTSHGTFYTYFDDKRDIMLALTQEAASAIYPAIAIATQAGPRLPVPSSTAANRVISSRSARYASSAARTTPAFALDQASSQLAQQEISPSVKRLLIGSGNSLDR